MITQALGGKRSGSGWMALCPSHDDRNPSLSLSDSESGLLWHCHAGCSQEAVAAAFRERGLLPPTTSSAPSSRSGFSNPGELAAWLARKAGATVSRVDLYSPSFAEIRLDEPAGKTYRPVHRLSDGSWKMGDPPGKLPLYWIDQLPDDPEITVLITEGPKCATAARTLGFFATTSPHGAKSAPKADWTPLRGRKCIAIWPDADEPGQKYASDVRAILISLGVPRERIRILDPVRFGLGEGEDIVDWIERHPGETPDLSGIPGRDDEPVKSNPDWMSQLDRTPTGRLIPNSRTLGLILRNDPAFAPLRFDEFAHLVRLGDRAIGDSDVFRFAEHIETLYGRGSIVPRPSLREAVEAIGTERSYHPIRDWLDGLSWDGKPRIGNLFSTYYGSKEDEYSSTIGKNLMIGAVARIYTPGVKFDHMIILEGQTGIRKSSSIRALFGADWFAEMKASPESKDFDAYLQGMWCLEFAELESFDQASVARIKLQLSTQSDWVRLSFRKDPARYPRQCIFVGSTNETMYLRDATGARRFWPVRCVHIDLEGIIRDRDQLWAEAVEAYKTGESWWTVPAAEAEAAQEERYLVDSWEEIVVPWLALQSEVTTSSILEGCLEIERGRHDLKAAMRIGKILTRQKWRRVKVRRGKDLTWVYRPPDCVPTGKAGTRGNKVGTSNTDATVPTVPAKKGNPASYGFGGDSPYNPIPSGNSGNSGNNPVSEPCSHLVPPSKKEDMVGTGNWTEVDPE